MGTSTHWTYEESLPDDADLNQGDILVPTGELRSVLEEVHPHFLNPKYTAFLLFTQSCDLVLRGSDCGTRYLNLAVVRPLESVLHDFLSHFCQPVATGVYLKESKNQANMLMSRLFNQNEQTLGLFYLHPDVDAGIAVPSVALLRVSVTLRSAHYSVLKGARRGRLRTEFRNKLGWLTGNLFSRIGTSDWTDPPTRKKELSMLIKDCLDGGEDPIRPIWVADSLVSAATEKGIQLNELDKEKVVKILEEHKPPTVKEQVTVRVLEIIKKDIPDISEDQIKLIRNRLLNDRLFSRLTKGVESD